MSATELWADVAKNYKIHQETIRFTEKTLAANKKIEFTKSAVVHDDNNQIFEVEVTELLVPSKDVKGGIPVSVYKPATSPKIPSILVFFHGGGLISGSRLTYDCCVKMMAKMSGAVILSVGYRLLPCPEDNFAPFNDAVTVTKWVLENKSSVGGFAESKVGVSGSSSGAQIACIVSHQVRGIDFQILVCPVADLYCNTSSSEEFRNIPAFNTKLMETAFAGMGVSVAKVANDPRFNPSAITDLELCPPTLIVSAQLDPLRDMGLEFASKLRAAGAKVDQVMIEGVPHGFFILLDDFPTTAEIAHTRVAQFIQLYQ